MTRLSEVKTWYPFRNRPCCYCIYPKLFTRHRLRQNQGNSVYHNRIIAFKHGIRSSRIPLMLFAHSNPMLFQSCFDLSLFPTCSVVASSKVLVVTLSVEKAIDAPSWRIFCNDVELFNSAIGELPNDDRCRGSNQSALKSKSAKTSIANRREQ